MNNIFWIFKKKMVFLLTIIFLFLLILSFVIKTFGVFKFLFNENLIIAEHAVLKENMNYLLVLFTLNTKICFFIQRSAKPSPNIRSTLMALRSMGQTWNLILGCANSAEVNRLLRYIYIYIY